jgi:hypothetical protein
VFEEQERKRDTILVIVFFIHWSMGEAKC